MTDRFIDKEVQKQLDSNDTESDVEDIAGDLYIDDNLLVNVEYLSGNTEKLCHISDLLYFEDYPDCIDEEISELKGSLIYTKTKDDKGYWRLERKDDKFVIPMRTELIDDIDVITVEDLEDDIDNISLDYIDLDMIDLYMDEDGGLHTRTLEEKNDTLSYDFSKQPLIDPATFLIALIYGIPSLMFMIDWLKWDSSATFGGVILFYTIVIGIPLIYLYYIKDDIVYNINYVRGKITNTISTNYEYKYNSIGKSCDTVLTDNFDTINSFKDLVDKVNKIKPSGIKVYDVVDDNKDAVLLEESEECYKRIRVLADRYDNVRVRNTNEHIEVLVYIIDYDYE